MVNNLKALSALIAFLLFLPAQSIADQMRVVCVIDGDGDSIKAAIDRMEINIRLVGIDAPEKSRKKREPGQPFSQKAAKYLASMVFKESYYN